MKIRPLTTIEDEYKYKLLSRVCFLYEADENYQEKLKESDENTANYTKIGAFDDDDNLLAGLYIIPYNMYFDGKPQKMAGIQGVITAPEARASGIMGKIMQECLAKMKNEGYIFSALYPFSYAYYRKFGYEVAHKLFNATIPLQELEIYPFPKGKVQFWQKGDSLDDIKAVYTGFAKRQNYAIVRSDADWNRIMDEDPYIAKKYTYVHYDLQNIPTSYVKFGIIETDPNEDKKMYIDELAWLDKSALHAILGFIAKLRPQFYELSWSIPNEIDPYSLFNEAWNIQVSNDSSMMFRIMNIIPALESMKAPTEEGGVLIQVKDKSFAENSGLFKVEWSRGKIAVEKSAAATSSPHMSTSIEALAQMIIGYSTPSMSANRKDTTINSPHSLPILNTLFPIKNRYIWEKF